MQNLYQIQSKFITILQNLKVIKEKPANKVSNAKIPFNQAVTPLHVKRLLSLASY